ncbi:glycosyltransferase family 2 protein, partial [Campylobacter sp. RM10534]|nr:glycosyltransferase family 2 protein [Campylobacter sp. RM10534]
FEIFIDQTNEKEKWSRLKSFNFLQNNTISPINWLQQSYISNQKEFAFAWGGMIDFSYLFSIKLKFIKGILFEDVPFGTILFAKSKNINILSKVLYRYRIKQ